MTAVDLDELERELLTGIAAAEKAGPSAVFGWAITAANSRVLALITELRTLRASAAEGQREWVKCSERLPRTSERVHILYESFGGPRVVIAVRETEAENGEANGWRADGGTWYPSSFVRVWSPLPSPPEKGST